MAVARKIKTLLTVNILVFVGIILFSVYCRLQDRSEGLVQIVRGADRRVRSRHAKVGALAEREAILQRLDHLEEVVYTQLNGEPSQRPARDKGAGQGGRVPVLGTLHCARPLEPPRTPGARWPTRAGIELLLLGRELGRRPIAMKAPCNRGHWPAWPLAHSLAQWTLEYRPPPPAHIRETALFPEGM